MTSCKLAPESMAGRRQDRGGHAHPWAPLLLLLLLLTRTAGAGTTCVCLRAPEPIRVDGRFDEAYWEIAPTLVQLQIVDGRPPPHPCEARMLWDERCLYVGLSMQSPNVWATIGPDTPEPRELWTSSAEAAARFIMLKDPFVKLLLDPDGDGQDYVEFHINALNRVNDVWLGHGSTRTDRQELDMSPTNYHLEWDCAGLTSAVHVQGTLNVPADTDQGWTAEIAIPWASLKALTKGSCPPKPGEVWRVMVGSVFREQPAGERTYATWPVMGVRDVHQPDRFGFVRFSAAMAEPGPDSAHARREGALGWKMVWVWDLPGKSEVDKIALAKSLGFNAVTSSDVQACRQAAMQAVGVAYLSDAPEAFRQALLPSEAERLKLQAETPVLNDLYQGGGEPLLGGEINRSNPWCLNRPEALAYAQKRVDQLLAAGHEVIALDGIGYKNYYACFCPLCREQQKQYAAAHPDIPAAAVVLKHSEECLLSFYQALVEHARRAKPQVRIVCHVWPYFAPNPEYGSQLSVDYSGETVSWFFAPHWSLEDVERRTRTLVRSPGGEARRNVGAPFVGVFTKAPNERHRKTAERVRQEIRIVKRSGASAIQMAELGNLLHDPAIATVVSEELGGTWKPDGGLGSK